MESGRPQPKFSNGDKCFAREAGELYPSTIRKRQFANGQWRYFVHYLGWNVRWDKWVGEFDLLADNEETRKIVKMVKQVKTRNKGGGGKRQKVQVEDDIPEGSAMNKLEQMDEEREAERRRLKFLENNSLVEVDNVNPFRAIENAGGKPMGNEAVMRINLPFPIKKMLVEDWEEMKNENSTRRQVLHLPVEVTVDKFLEDFKKDKKGNLKGDDLKKWDVFLQGLKLYFNKSLPALLLYKSERHQYASYFSSNQKAIPSSTYGVEHFCRMLIKLPYLLNSTGTASEGEVKSLLSKVGEITRWLCRDGGETLARGKYRKPMFHEMAAKELEKEKDI
ncbi:hypothetical protein TrCOL_g5725 [Triparma columacea]|uniref:MRG domain-containing protein n=1 Tax=Triparma columacea TaxID=722753 RepID=A0A9W7L4Y7_9STRA|nr:hypothetical protein TrCOL_g5725 [Triparma columacea]